MPWNIPITVKLTEKPYRYKKLSKTSCGNIFSYEPQKSLDVWHGLMRTWGLVLLSVRLLSKFACIIHNSFPFIKSVLFSSEKQKLTFLTFASLNDCIFKFLQRSKSLCLRSCWLPSWALSECFIKDRCTGKVALRTHQQCEL